LKEKRASVTRRRCFVQKIKNEAKLKYGRRFDVQHPSHDQRRVVGTGQEFKEGTE